MKRRKPPSLYIAAGHGRNVLANPEVTDVAHPECPASPGFFIRPPDCPPLDKHVVDQLRAELHAEREQHAFDVAELEKQIATLLRDLMQAKYELAQRNVVETFAKMESPSTRLH